VLEVSIRRRLGGFDLQVAFSAPTPGVTALFGRSGSGKTSVIDVVAGLAGPDEGRVVADGVVFIDTAKGTALRPERRRVGYVFQDARLFPHLSVAGNLRYGLRRAPVGERRIGLDLVVSLLGIERLLERRTHALSGGERQRVAVGRALLAQPRLLLMDEPLASLDAERKSEVLPYLERLRDELGLPIVYVSHDWGEVARLADTLVLLDAGRVVAAGPIGDLASRTDLPMLVRHLDAGSVIGAVVERHDDHRALTTLRFDGGVLVAPRLGASPGASLRVRISAREVILAGRPPESISVHNVLAGAVADIAHESGPHALVRVLVGPTAILARVTRDAVAKLGLGVGAPVYVLIKSVSLDRGGEVVTVSSPRPPA
jgi:molybdate transport system ATP-binding protein